MSNYTKVFYWLSLFFCIFFFIVPLVAIYLSDGIIYVGKVYTVSDNQFIYCLSVMFIFILGFVSVDLIKALYFQNNHDSSSRVNEVYNLSNIFYLFLFVYIGYNFYQSFFIDIAQEHYAIRRGEQGSDLVSFFISNVMNAIRLLLVLTLLKLNMKRSAILLVVCIILFSFLQSSGRLFLLIHFCMLILLVTSITPNRLVQLMIPGVVLIMPLLFSLKEIIYVVATGSFDFSTIDMFSHGINVYVQNFGHPLISFLQVDGLVELYGYSFFWDYIQGFLFYLKIIGLDFGLSITYYNTENLIGLRESIIPPGYFVLGYIQLGLLGVFLSGLTYRLIGVMGAAFFRVIGSEHKVALFYIAFICANSFYHGDFRIFVMSLFFPIIFCSILWRFTVRNGK